MRCTLLIAMLLVGACKREAPPPKANVNANVNANANANVNADEGKLPAATAAGDAAFWSWFKAHRVEIAKIKRADEPVAQQINEELHKIDPRLLFELGIGTEPKEFIVSADGVREAFPSVKRLVAAAPSIPGWKVIAFRPRKAAGLQIALDDGTKLSADDLAFVVLPTAKPPAPIDLILYAPGVGGANDEAVKQVSFLLLDATLGEYDVETRVGGIAIKPIGDKPANAKPLRELTRVIDAWK